MFLMPIEIYNKSMIFIKYVWYFKLIYIVCEAIYKINHPHMILYIPNNLSIFLFEKLFFCKKQ